MWRKGFSKQLLASPLLRQVLLVCNCQGSRMILQTKQKVWGPATTEDVLLTRSTYTTPLPAQIQMLLIARNKLTLRYSKNITKTATTKVVWIDKVGIIYANSKYKNSQGHNPSNVCLYMQDLQRVRKEVSLTRKYPQPLQSWKGYLS